MMKTKLPLFVAVVAVALFGMGCASVPKPDVPNAVKWNGHWYAVLPPADWDTAKQKCGQLGGHLAYAESSAENEFLVQLVNDSPLNLAPERAWLGGTDEKNEGDWVWLNGKSITKFFWKKGQPDNAGSEHYLELIWKENTGHPIRTWNDWSKNKSNVVICEWE